MSSDMVRMGVADKDFFRAKLRLVRIEPKAKLWNVQVTSPKFDSRKGHRDVKTLKPLKR
jgi:hypothetical protein